MAGKFQPPPIEGSKIVTEDGMLSDPFRRWLQLIPPAVTSPANSGSVPAKSNSQGIPGQMATDGNYLYVCTGVNQWKRTASPLSAF